MIVAIYSNIAIFVKVFVGSVGYSIYCDIPTNIYTYVCISCLYIAIYVVVASSSSS